jgi:hypothetical protein
MFALVAAIIWFFGAFGVQLGAIDMALFGMAFFALHFAFTWGLPVPAPWAGNRQP